MIELFLLSMIQCSGVLGRQYEFKVEVGKLKTVLELNNATNVSLSDESNQEFCWLENEYVVLQQSSLMKQQELEGLNKYYYLFTSQTGIWVLMNDMILTQLTHDGIIINQQKLQGNSSSFQGYYNEISENPIFLVDYHFLNDTSITFYHGAIKVYDGYLFVVNKFIHVYDLQNNTNKYIGQIDLTKLQNIIDYDIKKIDDKKYYLYLMDKYFGLTILKLLLRYNNFMYKVIYSEVYPLQNPKSFFCNEYNNCFGLYYNNVYKILNFKINFIDSSIFIEEILQQENKIIKLVNIGNMMFIQSKNIHKIYLYNSQEIQNIQIVGLKQISVMNSSLIYIITNTKLIKLELTINDPKVLCYCEDNEDCPQKYDYGINYADKTKMISLQFTIEFQTSLEDQMNEVLVIIFLILYLFGVLLLIFWIYSLKVQILLLEEKIRQGYQFMQKNKLPLFHTLENLAFTFRGLETLSKRIQQQESQEIQEMY